MDVNTMTLLIGVVLTLALFSYLLGDNLLYRWALALLVGSSVGYALAVAIRYVLLPRLAEDLRMLYVVPLILGALLLFKGFPRFAALGNLSMGFLLGVGAAVAVSGALLGTLLPQAQAAGAGVTLQAGLAPFLNGLLMLAGTILALFAFSPRVRLAGTDGGADEGAVSRRAQIGSLMQQLGRGFIIVALAAVFSGALTSALTLFVGRWWAVVRVLMDVVTGLMGS